MVASGFQKPSSCWIKIEDYDSLNDLTFYAKSLAQLVILIEYTQISTFFAYLSIL
jgi:hypothetical protein